MFSTCIFCHAALGGNDAIEHFPVGKRLAFDGERGRLWAVCPRCARWNLAPIEERWEALEQCERAYRGAIRRDATDNISLARLRDGTDLVRIGRPLLPEFALWRYGQRLVERDRRWARAEWWETSALFAMAGSQVWTIAGHRDLLWLTGPMALALTLFRRWIYRERHGPIRRMLRDRRGLAKRIIERPFDLRLRRVGDRWSIEEQEAAWRLAWPRRLQRAPLRLDGSEVMHLLPALLVVASPIGSSEADVHAAVARVEREETVDSLMQQIASTRGLGSAADEGKLISAPTDVRLALEMTLQQEDERRALAGELGTLYARWQDAERIARIADGELTQLPRAE